MLGNKNQQRTSSFDIIARGETVAILSSDSKLIDCFIKNLMQNRRDSTDWCYSRGNTEVCIFHLGDMTSRREIIMAIENLAPRFNCTILQLRKK